MIITDLAGVSLRLFIFTRSRLNHDSQVVAQGPRNAHVIINHPHQGGHRNEAVLGSNGSISSLAWHPVTTNDCSRIGTFLDHTHYFILDQVEHQHHNGHANFVTHLFVSHWSIGRIITRNFAPQHQIVSGPYSFSRDFLHRRVDLLFIRNLRRGLISCA